MAEQQAAPLDSLQRIRDWITEGVTLDFISEPAYIDHDNTFTVDQHADAVRERLQEYIEFEAVIPLPDDHPCPYGVQPLHVIIKPDKKPRIVVDLKRNLNGHLAHELLHYSTVEDAVELSWPGCWYSKLDLSNCFLSFPLHASALPHLIVRFEGRLYQFVRLPFGLSSAPFICTELLSVVAFRLSQLGIDPLVRYLDDFLLINATAEAGEAALITTQQTFSDFGLVVNPAKTVGPEQRLAFLGILLDSQQQTLACTPERVAELSGLLAASAGTARMKLTALQSLIGKLQFAAQVLPGFRPFIRRMQDLSSARDTATWRERHARRGDRHLRFALHNASVRIDRGFRADVDFWQRHLLHWNGAQRWRSARSSPIVISTDASLDGFGFHMDPQTDPETIARWPVDLGAGSGFCGSYSPQDAPFHAASGDMTWCELFAVYAALSTYRAVLRDCTVLFRVDNMSSVCILLRQATRSSRLAGLLREIFAIAVESNISIDAVHRSGESNTLADFLSRPELHGGGDIIAAWRTAHPDRVADLLSVSFVCSQQFGNQRSRPSSSTSATIDWPPTLSAPTARRATRTSASASSTASTRRGRPASRTSASS